MLGTVRWIFDFNPPKRSERQKNTCQSGPSTYDAFGVAQVTNKGCGGGRFAKAF
jgi:hypothetical protein